MKEATVSTYYKKLIGLVLELYHDELATAEAGHCIKITAFGNHELNYLWQEVRARHTHLGVYIVADRNDAEKYVSATKLIELRNRQEHPLLILVPSNSRTAAEDSYGNATFKELSLEGVETKLKDKLIAEIPDEYKKSLEDIFQYLSSGPAKTSHIINYLIALEEAGFTDENVGNLLYHLRLIPDADLLVKKEQTRSRLNFNLMSTEQLSSFNKPLYDRITELPLEPNTLQAPIVSLLKTEKNVKSDASLGEAIYNHYPSLNFSQWLIPDLTVSDLQLTVEHITSGDRKTAFKNVGHKWVLQAERGKSSKLKIRVKTNRPPKDIPELAYFRIVLMMVDGGSGEVMQDLRLAKNTNSSRSYRDLTFEIDSTTVEEGSYFIKVLAEDEHGSVLNANDGFKSQKIQQIWQEKGGDTEAKAQLNFKLTCDSEDFDYSVDEEIEESDDQKKDKVNNVLQAFFQYRMEQFISGKETDFPKPSENSNNWLGDEKKKLTSTFHINYTTRHNYQINLSTKLREIESEFLKNHHHFGYVSVTLNANASVVDIDSSFIESKLTELIPADLINLRTIIFQRILRSNDREDGIFETADLFNLYDEIKQYLQKFNDWLSELRAELSTNTEKERDGKLQQFLAEIQVLDLVKVNTKLPDGTAVSAFLLPPLHPLRLAWFAQLMEVFFDWEQRTKEYAGHIDSWKDNLGTLFEGNLSPQNNSIVFVEPTTFKSFHYVGELSYGWGLYVTTSITSIDKSLTSMSRQLKHYFRQLFNISKGSYVESDISQKLIIRHIRNYLLQHSYTDKLIINLINADDASVFADALVALENDRLMKDIKYEVRIFKGSDRIIEHGEALKNLINPEYNVSEEAEPFSRPSKNRLSPKLRFSINSLNDYIKVPSQYGAHLSFIISPFPIQIELEQPYVHKRSFFANGLLTEATVIFEETGSTLQWKRYIQPDNAHAAKSGIGRTAISIFDNLQTLVGSALATQFTESLPTTQLTLTDRDKVLLAHLHDYSDWVVTFDRTLGPQVFDQPSKDDRIPFLIDYVPGENVAGVSSYLTTRPTSEVLGLLGPHFEEFGLDIHNPNDEHKIKILLEDLRAMSSSLILQLNSSKNKAFEVIGTAFTKRVLEKKGLLKESFLVPIDLHQNLFDDTDSDSKSRADALLVSINPDRRQIAITVIEIKCRKALGESEKEELKVKMREQILNTITALRYHFDPEYHMSFDRLDRSFKNKELSELLSFYIDRANRYHYLDDNAFGTYNNFLQSLDDGFKLSFNQLGLIFDFSAEQRHKKEHTDDKFTFFTFGGKLIDDILDPNSDLNTQRLEEGEFVSELKQAVGFNELKPFIQEFKARTKPKMASVEKLPITEEVFFPTQDISSDDISSSTQREDISEVEVTEKPNESKKYDVPGYDVLVGKTNESPQFGILGKSIHGRKIAIDLSETNTISLFGVQGGGKSYTIGTISEMVLKQFSNINKLPAPLAGVIFHYSESMDYEPEFTSMVHANDKASELRKLKEEYGAEPGTIDDVVILTPKDKIEERKLQYPSIEVAPIAFNSKELNVQDWLFLLGAIGNDSAYIKQLKAIMKEHRRNITLSGITESVEASDLLSNAQKSLARQKLSFAREYVDDIFCLTDILKPGRLIVVDLRDEFIVKDEALGLFVIMLNVFSAVKNVDDQHFNKFIVFDEAHKYMSNKDLTGNIVTAIREMRHKGVSIMIASQDPPSLPNEIIELSSIVLLHKFNSPLWLKHIQRSITQLSGLTPTDMSALAPGEGFLWTSKATERSITHKPVKVSTRPRATKHGGSTVQAIGRI